MSALEDLKKLQDAVRKELPVIKDLMAYANPDNMTEAGREAYTSAMRSVDKLQRLVQTDSGNVGITVPTGRMGVKGQ